MKYKMKVWLDDPALEKGLTAEKVKVLDCSFSYNAQQYGNGYCVMIRSRELGDFGNFFDLRYDETFDPDAKMGWLVTWAQKYWSGKDGAWELKKIEVQKG